MKNIEINPLEQLNIRIANQQMIIEAAQIELSILLQEREKLTDMKPI